MEIQDNFETKFAFNGAWIFDTKFCVKNSPGFKDFSLESLWKGCANFVSKYRLHFVNKVFYLYSLVLLRKSKCKPAKNIFQKYLIKLAFKDPKNRRIKEFCRIIN